MEDLTDFEVVIDQFGHGGVRFVVIGGLAAVVHGSSLVTFNLDLCYAADPRNAAALVQVLWNLNAVAKGSATDLPLKADKETLKAGLNFSFETQFGPLNLLGQIPGVGGYDVAVTQANFVDIAGLKVPILSLQHLIDSKKAMGRARDLLILQELEAIQAAKALKPVRKTGIFKPI